MAISKVLGVVTSRRQKPKGEEMSELMTMLHELESARFYGSLEVKFESGHITIIRKTESIRPARAGASYPKTGGTDHEFCTSSHPA